LCLGGILFLGNSESAAGCPELFKTLDKKQNIFVKIFRLAGLGSGPGRKGDLPEELKFIAQDIVQSTREELETAKEELQCSNEELITSNEELRNRNDEAFRLNNDLMNLLGSINMPVIMMGKDLAVRRITSQAEKVLNVTSSDIGRPISKIKLNVDIPDLDKILAGVMASLRPKTLEIKDREGSWYSAYIRPYRTLDNKTDGAVAVFVDITERKKIAGELARANEQQYRTLIDNLPQKVFLKDRNSVYISCNENYAKDLKIKPEEIAGKTDHDFFPTHLAEKYRADDKKVMESGKTENIEEEYVLIGDFLEGSQKSIINTVKVPVRDKAGRVTGLFGFFWDITERKQTEETLRANEALKRLDQIKSDFVSTVSHELRTPLTPIRESVCLVYDGVLGEINEKQKRSLFVGLKNIDRLSRLIDNLLDISKIEAGKIEVNKEPVNIKELVDGVVETFSTLAKTKGLELKSKIEDKAVEVYADFDKTTQVLANLVGNAMKFTAKGSVTISLEEKGEVFECMVSDTGQGLAPEDLLRIFNKFQQFGRGSDAGDKGTGLGLAISKGIIEAQGGKIGVKSKLGQGTDFTFTLQKYDRDAVLREKINTKMAKARGKEAAFYLFSLRIENYSKIEEKPGESKMKNIVREIAKSLENIIRRFTVVEESAQGRLVVLIEYGGESLNAVKNKTKRAVKDAIFELSGGLPVDFSYGWAAYPQDGLDADKLLQKAYAGMVSEKEERLGKNILIIDDEPMIRGALKRSLQGAGYSSVDEAGDGEDGLAKIKASVPGLVILDIRMPKMNGYEVIGRLRENTETKDIPVLIMSGYEVESGKLEDHLKKKAIPIIAKPFEMEQVLRLVDYLL
jgi:PAS domain S-box-containing protein